MSQIRLRKVMSKWSLTAQGSSIMTKAAIFWRNVLRTRISIRVYKSTKTIGSSTVMRIVEDTTSPKRFLIYDEAALVTPKMKKAILKNFGPLLDGKEVNLK